MRRSLPEVQAGIAATMPKLTGEFTGQELHVVGGLGAGLTARWPRSARGSGPPARHRRAEASLGKPVRRCAGTRRCGASRRRPEPSRWSGERGPAQPWTAPICR